MQISFQTGDDECLAINTLTIETPFTMTVRFNSARTDVKSKSDEASAWLTVAILLPNTLKTLFVKVTSSFKRDKTR